jgi:hypothetical protein
MSWLIVLLIVVAVVAIGALAYDQGRTAALKRRFGPEYDRAVATGGGRRQAEAGLRDIVRRRGELDLRPLPGAVRSRFEQRWREAQLRFVDQPSESVGQAGALVAELLRERGYPADPEERIAMLSADHPDLVANYRTAQGADAGAGVEPLRQAFVHYRDVFERMVEAEAPAIPLGPVTGDDEDERPSPLASAYGTVLRAARRVDPAGGRFSLRRREGRPVAESERYI